MTDKELNSHDLAREIEISKLQEENKELKSQLRGTTHCYDEEEHNKLKEEITNLSKDVDMWNAKYNDMFDENKRLKNQQQEFIKYLTSYIELLNNKPDLVEEGQKDILKEILQKYKEIIGVKDENDTQI